MSVEAKKKSPGPSKVSKSEAQEIVNNFHKLREEQRLLVQKVTDIENEEHEYNVVIQTLDGIPPERVCFRLIGGVLVERTVGDVVPALTQQRDQMKALVETLNKNIENKGREINEYREKHGIRIQGEPEQSEKKESSPAKKSDGPSGVLVAS
jgi:prefoldin subunit 2